MTANIRTKEQKRATRAMPPPLDQDWSRVGGVSILALFAAFCGWMYSRSGWTVWLVIGIPATSLLVIIIATLAYEVGLLFAVHATLVRRGVRCLVVHSQSPVWRAHVASQWLPRLGPRCVALDWSDRARWKATLAVAVFRHFAGQQNFNPAVIVFRGVRRPLVFRFYRAFHEAKHGRTAYLQTLEEQMFRVVGGSHE